LAVEFVSTQTGKLGSSAKLKERKRSIGVLEEIKRRYDVLYSFRGRRTTPEEFPCSSEKELLMYMPIERTDGNLIKCGIMTNERVY
jgi:hypothetical protein